MKKLLAALWMLYRELIDIVLMLMGVGIFFGGLYQSPDDWGAASCGVLILIYVELTRGRRQ